ILNPNFCPSVHSHSVCNRPLIIGGRTNQSQTRLAGFLDVYFRGYGKLSFVFWQSRKALLPGQRRTNLRRVLRDETRGRNRLSEFLHPPQSKPLLRSRKASSRSAACRSAL